jgi:hypothetical protein
VKHIDFFAEEDPGQPQPDENLAMFANREAQRISQGEHDWAVNRKRKERIINNPHTQQLAEAPAAKRFLGWFLCAIFSGALLVQWYLSGEVYESFLFFIGLVLAGLYISLCWNNYFIDFKSRYSTSERAQEFYEIVYETDGSRDLPRWYFAHPLNGLVLFILIEILIYQLSAQRVALREQAGLESDKIVWFACVLYFFEIIGGMGVHYTFLRVFTSRDTKGHEAELIKESEELEERKHNCIDARRKYEASLAECKPYYAQHNLALPLIEPNSHMRKLLIDAELLKEKPQLDIRLPRNSKHGKTQLPDKKKRLGKPKGE